MALFFALAMAALTFGHANVQPLWEDETYGLFFAQRSLPSLLQALATSEPHLPPYFLLLRLWEGLAGPGAFAERWPSAACFVLTGVVVYRLAMLLAGRLAGTLAIGFWAMQPEGFWYGQEVRMYAPLIFWAALAGLLLARAMRDDRRRDWLFFALAELAALWTHYSGAFVVLVAGAMVVGFAGQGKRVRALAWVSGPALTYLPWLWYVRHIRPPTAQPAGSLPTQTLTVGKGLLLGYGGPLLPPALTVGLLALLLVTVTLALVSGRRSLQMSAAPVAVILLTPLAIPPVHFLFNPRYLCLACPFIAVLWAVACSELAQRSRPVAFMLGALVAAGSLAGMAVVLAPNFRHWYNYPAAMAYVRQQEQPGQLLVDNSGVDPTARYYYQDVDGGTLPLLLLPPFHPGSVPDIEQTALALSQRYTGIWLVPDAARTWDGDRVVERALNSVLLPAGSRRFSDVTVDYYRTARGLAEQRPAAATFAGGIRLAGFGVSVAGSHWAVAFHWQALRPLAHNYTVFVQALDAGGRLVGQGDGPPDGGRQPTGRWIAGTAVYDLHRVPIPANAGPLHLIVGWYDPSTGVRLPVDGGGDSVNLGPLPAPILRPR